MKKFSMISILCAQCFLISCASMIGAKSPEEALKENVTILTQAKEEGRWDGEKDKGKWG